MSRKVGYASAFQRLDHNVSSIEPIFHPFRLYVLHHAIRVFKTNASWYQYLFDPEGSYAVSQFERQHLDHWTQTMEFAERFEDWNRIAEFSINCGAHTIRAFVRFASVPLS